MRSKAVWLELLLLASFALLSSDLRAEPKGPPVLTPRGKGAPASTPIKVPNVPGGAVRPPTLPAAPIVNDVDFTNWGFEHGLDGWMLEGDAFNQQPTAGNNVVTQRVLSQMELSNNGIGGDYWKNEPYPIGIKGGFWVGTFEARPNSSTPLGTTQGDARTGTLTSPEVTKKFCEFLIGGGSDPNGVRVELLVQDGGKGSFRRVDQKTSFRNSEELYRTDFDLTRYKDDVARIRIVDSATGDWGHINVDDFRFVDAKPPGILLRSGRTKYHVDGDAPVWGSPTSSPRTTRRGST